MVPFADNINHENVDTGFDCVDANGETLYSITEKTEQEDEEKRRKQQAETFAQLTQLKTEMLECEIALRRKMAEEGCETQSEEAKNDLEMSLKFMQATAKHLEEKQAEERASQELAQLKQQEKQKQQPAYEGESSGLESDNDVDLIVEQEVLKSFKNLKKEKAEAEETKDSAVIESDDPDD